MKYRITGRSPRGATTQMVIATPSRAIMVFARAPGIPAGAAADVSGSNG
jgi:hypothetical protein